MDHPFINNPSSAQVKVLVQAGFTQEQARCFVKDIGRDRWAVAAGFESGNFGWYATHNGREKRPTWRGPIFDDPLAAFVHAEVCEWKS